MADWTKKIVVDERFGAKTPPLWPNEFLVKIMSSHAYSNLYSQIPNNARALEVGIFAGNNARMLKDKGFNVFGIEVNEEMVSFSLESLKRFGITDIEVKAGSNIDLDFPSDFFDVLVSINTLHYSVGNEIDLAIQEFARVIKPGGFAVIETPSSEHYIPKQCKRLSECKWEWQAGGFRNGDHVGFLDSKEHFGDKCKSFFTTVEILSRCEEFTNTKLAWWIAVVQK